MTPEPTDPTKRGPAVPPVPPPPPAVPRYEPKVSAPDEDLPGAPPVQREAPDRGVAESATLAGHPADPTHPRQPSVAATSASDAPTAPTAPTGGAAPVVRPASVEAPAAPTAAASAQAAASAPAASGTATDPRPAPIEDWLRLQVAEGRWSQPHDVLGPHPVDGGTSVRVVRHLARAVRLVRPDGDDIELTHEGDGLWAGATAESLGRYRVESEYDYDESTDEDDATWTTDDAYRFAPTLGELDLHLFGEGRDEQLWHHLGAHARTVDGVDGVAFAVWAPRATAVRVIGDFEGWEGRTTAMRRLSDLGVWELFWPGAVVGQRYKFQILTDSGWVERADPFAREAEIAPATASVVTESTYTWSEGDAAWMERRAQTTTHDAPMSVYEVHLGSWRPGLSYREVADQLIGHVEYTGFTHVEFLPLAEHPFGGSWGYQVTGYYAPTARFGSPDDLRYLIDRLHSAGIGVIMDWVPGHFPKDEWALGRFDGYALFEHPDPRRGEQLDWGTYVFDFGQPQVRNFLVANALYWFEEFHIDGLRVDAVASMLYLDYSRTDWLPNVHGGRENLDAISFLQETNATAYKRYPGIVMIAEESTSWPGVTQPTSAGGLGFGQKWNMGWMHDSLEYVQRDPAYRSYHHDEITFSFVYAFSEQFTLPISHDEVVHGKGSLYGKMPGDEWQKLANVRAYLAFMWAHPGKQLLFMGQEFAQPAEWSEAKGLDWWLLDQPGHRGVQDLVAELNRMYKDSPALWTHDSTADGFERLEGGDAPHSTLGFLRKDGDDRVAVFVNFSGVPVERRFGLPTAGEWHEVLNTDAAEYGGSGVGNLGVVTAEDTPWAGRPASAHLVVPPLGAVWLKLAQ
ncbi:1,4-alpha-glucan branching protein GlgB [Curtobacterium flaccumfaciens]|uniref:1,4-alpha-glucan branching protein GlgB n=1 Tax=Curtobacterium flaccumfaciens TaxID=2035 RepID=UPI00220AA648|nr:1,4-alpha-glucan branching protein GlgB [Curtobacterium flaccumfaciens]MCS0472436.1 1,4-alpha-glucan branching protein GlgB [Curtobacterium flaccumfaciens pv. betae]MCS0474657.1 1,4-alpha-glucan branching protein GlgB [Curtobacterium flaccumfaciens pv. betae]MCS0479176.1 1,4-alpha-glucan branching protein GlgB [Curtobacterium flaccumfaciens pv. betae]MCS0480733.1 1,4-alpha-glucan branching protein GlgB [Curtobacterium flaccumfaciens pv. betae]MCS0486040.1 1,4-alpha-glucan branching protein 